MLAKKNQMMALVEKTRGWPYVTADIHEWATANPTDVTSRLSDPSGPDVCSSWDMPWWNLHRFGMSHTVLPSGREVFVGGEHEDYYDPNFFIYNDVIVRDTDGSIRVYAYSRDVFPPTDFHVAVLYKDDLWIFGSIGYDSHLKKGAPMQVLRLDLNTFAMEKIVSDGGPKWVHWKEDDPSKPTLLPDGNIRIGVRGNWVFDTVLKKWV